MRLHLGTFLGSERPGLEQHVVGDADFANVVQRSGQGEVIDVGTIHPASVAVGLKLLGEGGDVGADAFEVFAGVDVARFGELGQAKDHRVTGLAKRPGALFHRGFEARVDRGQAGVVAADDEDDGPGGDRHQKTCHGEARGHHGPREVLDTAFYAGRFLVHVELKIRVIHPTGGDDLQLAFIVAHGACHGRGGVVTRKHGPHRFSGGAFAVVGFSRDVGLGHRRVAAVEIRVA